MKDEHLLSPSVLESVDAFMSVMANVLPREGANDEAADVHAQTLGLIRESVLLLVMGAWRASADHERRQWSLPADMPNDPRTAHAQGLYQAIEALERAKASGGGIDEALEIVRTISIYIAPTHERGGR